jgi:two-component system sensor histidine kinase QseC
MALVVLNLVGGFHALGTLLAVGIMMLPAVAARFWATDLTRMIVISVGVAFVSGYGGLLERVRDALERERRFTAAAAHELRTPLAALKVHAQNAARAPSPAERDASLQRMLEGLDRTVHLAEQMLAYSRAAAPGDAARRARVALGPLVAEAVEVLQPRATERRVTIRTRGPGGEVHGDRQKLASLINNLLDNAVRYGPPGGCVEVELGRDGDAAVLAVEDAGPGIAPELRARVFESYYRIPGTAGTGSGLGLAIVKEIADAHGASVSIGAPAAGAGTRVAVRFARALID